MSILAKITVNQELFSPNEKKISEYILSNPISSAMLSSQNLAEEASVSQSSIVKFVQKIGFKGFIAFKLALSEELGRKHAITNSMIDNISSVPLHNTITQDDSLANIIKKLLQEKNHAVIETSNALDMETLTQVVDLLDQARVIQVIGIGGSALVAKDFANKLLKIGYIVICETDAHTQLTIAQTLTANDVQVAISFSGNKKEITLAAELAVQSGAKVVGITSLQESPLRELVHFALSTIAQEEWRSSSISSRTAQHTATDLLFMALLQKRDVNGKILIDGAQQIIQKLAK